VAVVAGRRERDRRGRRFRVWAAALATGALVTFVVPALAHARPGDLDRSFGSNGRVALHGLFPSATYTDIGRKGRIVVAGAYGDDFIVARLTHTGGLDRSFAGDGSARISSGSPLAAAATVAISHNGGVVVAGKACTEDAVACHIAVSRLKPDGQLDRRFGQGGLVRIDFGRQFETQPAVALTRHGRIIVKAWDCPAGGTGDCQVGLARLLANGSLDITFGNHGKALTPTYWRKFGGCAGSDSDVQNVDSMALDSRLRIVVLLTCARKKLALARFRPSGHRDRSLGKHGTMFKDVDMGAVTSLATDSRNRIDVAGSRSNGFAVARFQPDGKVDHSFGKKGIATARFASNPNGKSVPYSLALDSRGRIVAGGALGPTSRSGAAGAFARFTPEGHPNHRFGHRGTVISDRGLRFVASIAIDSRNRIVGAGNVLVRLLG
jgi:uncharacterized delta-60 repeat protein